MFMITGLKRFHSMLYLCVNMSVNTSCQLAVYYHDEAKNPESGTSARATTIRAVYATDDGDRA
jgi:hypothetical protein